MASDRVQAPAPPSRHHLPIRHENLKERKIKIGQLLLKSISWLPFKRKRISFKPFDDLDHAVVAGWIPQVGKGFLRFFE